VAKKPKAERKQKLKVFVTPIGFHDAYVAAPSRKAALEAWGADANIFAQGIAEQVTDPKLMEEPLERPGKVIRRLRGSHDEHVAELAKTESKKKSPTPTPPLKRRGEKAKPRVPKPSRDELDAAEEALERAEKKHRKTLSKIDEQVRKLERERRDLQRKHERERDRLAEDVEKARSAYERAMRAWKG
jgi:hypothetical protein